MTWSVEDLLPKSVKMLAKTNPSYRPVHHSWHDHVVIHRLGHLRFPIRFDGLEMSLVGIQPRPDSYAIEDQIIGFNVCCVSFFVAKPKCWRYAGRAIVCCGRSKWYKEGWIVMRFMLSFRLVRTFITFIFN